MHGVVNVREWDMVCPSNKNVLDWKFALTSSSLTLTRAKFRPCFNVFFSLYAISFICMLYCHGAQLSQSQHLNSTCTEIKFFSASVFSWKPNMSKS